MRLIDADAYLDSIKPRGISDELWKECKEYKSITAFPAIEISPVIDTQPYWIPCSERVPEKVGMYLITEQNYSFKEDALLVHTSYFNAKKEFEDTFYIPEYSNITAWMPLPAPYHGKRKEVDCTDFIKEWWKLGL